MTKVTWFINLIFSVFALTFILYSAVANTAPPILIDQQTEKYLGNLYGDSMANLVDQQTEKYLGNLYGDSMADHAGPNWHQGADSNWHQNSDLDWNQNGDPMWNGDEDPMEW